MLDSSKVRSEEVKQNQILSGKTLTTDKEKLFPGRSLSSPWEQQKSNSNKEEIKMAENKTMFIGVAQIQQDWGISRSKAYQIIKDLRIPELS